MIRLATARDTEAVRVISEQVFSYLGDYGTYLPRYLEDAWVTTSVDETAGVVRGFVMVGLAPSRRAGAGAVADLLAIAVAPEFQRQGLGTAFLAHAFVLAADLQERYGVTEMELSVADANPGAQRFFARHGFRVVDAAEGRYPAGQVAIRMARLIAPPPP
ncbi:MAG TPA: N-acetyltransferase [Polyangia bacterium]